MHDMNPPDHAGVIFLELQKKQIWNESLSEETYAPAPLSNRMPTTIAPSPAPSNGPTNVPSVEPSDTPSEYPTSQPSDRPSEHPSVAPTLDPYPRIGSPREGEPGFFNYDQSPDSLYGPAKWGSVGLPASYYWDEFGSNGYGPWKGVLSERSDIHENLCEKGLKHQSPIDVHVTFGECMEKHEVRDHPGDFPLYDERVDKRIEANKLRIIFPRRPCPNINLTECQFPHPPWGDFPNGWKFTADVMHIDFKIPGEHWLQGERYDGEMQIFHLHPLNKRMVAYSSLVRALPAAHNNYLQTILDAFQHEYDKNHAACAQGRNAVSEGNVTTTMPSPAPSSTNISHSSAGRDLHGIPDAFNPYDPGLITSYYFYRYDGSITEPPCSEFVTWFVSDAPMLMSLEQLEQWRRLQFTNVDPARSCQSNSVHSGRSVARPITPPAADRQVTHCTMANFLPDPK